MSALYGVTHLRRRVSIQHLIDHLEHLVVDGKELRLALSEIHHISESLGKLLPVLSRRDRLG